MRNLKIIEEKLKKNKTYLKENFSVKKIGVFGSYSKGEETPDSDIDILVEFFEPLDGNFLI